METRVALIGIIIEDKTSYVSEIVCTSPIDVMTSYNSKKEKLIAWSQLGNGNKVEVKGLNANKDWFYLDIQGCKGWVKKQFVK